jgi:hypothetical protein
VDLGKAQTVTIKKRSTSSANASAVIQTPDLPNTLYFMLTPPLSTLSKLITKEEPCDSNSKKLVASKLHLDLSEALGLCFVKVAYRDGYRTSFIDGPLHMNTIGAYRALLDHLEVRMWKDEPWFTADQHERMVQSQTLWKVWGSVGPNFGSGGLGDGR